jgi:hypothetical protein
VTRKGFATPFIVIGILLLLIIGGCAYLFNKSHKSLSVTTSPEALKPAASSINSTSNWKTSEKFGLSIRYPEQWSLQEYSKPATLSSGLTTLFYLDKPNLSKDISAPDEPTKNLVMMDFRYKKTTKTPEQVANNFAKEIGFTIQAQNWIRESGKFAGHDAVYIYEDMGGVTPKKADYPTHVIFSSSPNQITLITTQFFFVNLPGADTEYWQKTTSEINGVLSSIKTTNNQQATFISGDEALKVIGNLPDGFLFDKSQKGKVGLVLDGTPTPNSPYWNIRIYAINAAKNAGVLGTISWAYVNAQTGKFVCAWSENGKFNPTCAGGPPFQVVH